MLRCADLDGAYGLTLWLAESGVRVCWISFGYFRMIWALGIANATNFLPSF